MPLAFKHPISQTQVRMASQYPTAASAICDRKIFLTGSKNIKGRFNSGLKAVMQLQPIRYQYKPDNALGLKSEGEQIGFGAQALQKVIPEAVTRKANGYLMVNNDPILWTMLNAHQRAAEGDRGTERTNPEVAVNLATAQEIKV